MVQHAVGPEVLHVETTPLPSEIIAQAQTMERMIKSAVRLITRESVAGKAPFKRHIFYLILRLQSLDDKHLSHLSHTTPEKFETGGFTLKTRASNVFRLHYAGEISKQSPVILDLCLRKTRSGKSHELAAKSVYLDHYLEKVLANCHWSKDVNCTFRFQYQMLADFQVENWWIFQSCICF